MRVINDKSGSQVESIQEYEIAAATVVSEGMCVKLTSNKVVAVVAGETSPILGVAKENHPGTADTLNIRGNGLKILVSDSPTAIMASPAPRATATGGSTTTFVVSGLNNFADSDFVGGKLKVISKVATSTNTDPIGTVYDITGFTNATGTFTITAISGAVTVGDIMEIYPPIGFAKGNFDSGFTKLVLTASAALPIKVVGYDTDMGTIRHEASLHEFGNKKS